MNIDSHILTKLVSLLNSGNFDSKAMVIKLAKIDPTLFVELAETTSAFNSAQNSINSLYGVTSTPKFDAAKVLEALRNAGKISAIKTLQKCKQSLGLKEAKDIIERFEAYLEGDSSQGPELSVDDFSIYDALIIQYTNE